jgi:hypothetical protein
MLPTPDKSSAEPDSNEMEHGKWNILKQTSVMLKAARIVEKNTTETS